MKKNKWIGELLTGVLLVVLCVSIVHAAIPETINYQGYLTDNSGNPIDTTVSMTFKIYTVASGGTAIWTETRSIPISNGIFNVALGSTNPLFLDYSVNSQYYLGVQVGADAEMTPRQLLTSVGSSHTADTALDLVCTNCVSGAEVNLSEIQKRVTGTCAAGNSIREIKSDGTVTCEPDDGIAAETDPQVGAVTLFKWCVGDGSAVQCSVNQPVLSETDPKVGVLTSGKWCTTNGSQVICTAELPVTPSAWTDDGTVVRLTTNTDKVGIGTSTLSEELHVKDTVGQIYLQGIFQGTSSSGGIALLASNGQQYEIQSLNNGDFTLYDRNDGKHVIYADTNQNVGIGTNTPSAKLHVAGDIRLNTGGASTAISTGNDTRLSLYSNTSATNSRAWIELWGNDAGRSGELTLAGTYTDFRYGSTDTSAGIVGMRLTSGGNLGIGTSVPSEKLQVEGNLLVKNTAAGKSLRLRTNADALDFDISGHNLYVNGDSGYIMFLENATRSVGIGTDDPKPGYKLDVGGNMHVSGMIKKEYSGTTHRVIPAAYGDISPTTEHKLTNNFTVTRDCDNKQYEISIDGETNFCDRYAVSITFKDYGAIRIARTGTLGCELIVITVYDIWGNPQNICGSSADNHAFTFVAFIQ
jgi:hypothetical protein